MEYTNRKVVCFQIYISLIIAIFLLCAVNIQALGAEVVLNSAFSVNLPEKSSANPGEFITYVLELNNRSSREINLQVEYNSVHNWNVIGDVNITVPAHTNKQYFPVTIFIPQNAPAGLEELVRVRFKLNDATFPLPDVALPVHVNSVSAIQFNTPQTANGVYGSSVNYDIVVTNTGNTTEQFSVTSRSFNLFFVKLQPEHFELAPGASQTVTVTLMIPVYTAASSDQLELTFAWGREQKVINLTTFIVDKLNSLSSQYYIWKGNLHLNRPFSSSATSDRLNGELSLSGQLGPDSTASFYSSNQAWFAEINQSLNDVKIGKFPLTWQGLASPKLGHASLFATTKLGAQTVTVSRWVSADRPGEYIWGTEAFLNSHSSLRYLYDPAPSQDQNIVEWNYQTSKSDSFWSNTLAVDPSHQGHYAGSVHVATKLDNWQWNSYFQYLQRFYDTRYQRSFASTLALPPLKDYLTGYFQGIYEAKQLREAELLNNYDNYQFNAYLTLLSKYQFYATRSFYYRNDELDSDNLSWSLGSQWESGLFTHEWLISHSADADQTEPKKTHYASFDWYTRYQLNPSQQLILNPQLNSDESRLGLGLKQRWAFGPELLTVLYPYIDPSPKFNWTINLDWPIYQYQLLFKYSGIWDASGYTTDYCSLTVNKKFSYPVKKPLGTVAGVAFIDKNRNGVRDDGEPTVTNLSLLADNRTTAQTDSQGNYSLGGLNPGEHQVTIDPRYNVIYNLEYPDLKVNLKPYQTVTLNLPLIRTQNITGRIYQDRNQNQRLDPTEKGIPGVPLILKNLETGEVSQTFTDLEGTFTFTQLNPTDYQLTVDSQALPEDWQTATDFHPLSINARQLEDQAPLQIGLIPYEKPVEIIALPTASLTLELHRELAYFGDIVKITIETSDPLKRLTLTLPDHSVIQLDPKKTHWSYSWKVGPTTPVGEGKIRCVGETTGGTIVQEDINIVILQR